MRILVQRCQRAEVSVSGNTIGKIAYGMLVLVGFTDTDTEEQVDYLVDKLIHLRIFDDEQGIMNRSLLEIQGELLSVSQFTLYADTKKGRRPSYSKALNGTKAKVLYEQFNQKLREAQIYVATGEFGADMQVSLVNDGPVTILLER